MGPMRPSSTVSDLLESTSALASSFQTFRRYVARNLSSSPLAPFEPTCDVAVDSDDVGKQMIVAGRGVAAQERGRNFALDLHARTASSASAAKATTTVPTTTTNNADVISSLAPSKSPGRQGQEGASPGDRK